jgi:predicted nucleic acid-binding protein
MTVLDTDLVSAFLRPDARERYPRLTEFVTDLVHTEGLSIAFVTQYELRRGFEELLRRGQGHRLLVRYEKLLARVEVLGLDAGAGDGWNRAASLWAEGRTRRPSIVFKDADLLIAATAEFHGRSFATCEARLAENLRAIGFSSPVVIVKAE